MSTVQAPSAPRGLTAGWTVLGSTSPGSVLLLGGPDEEDEALPGCRVARELPAGERFDLVAVRRPAPAWASGARGLAAPARAVAPGGSLCVELCRPGPTLAGLTRVLQPLGFSSVTGYWARDGRWLPLGAPAVHRWYLDHLYFAATPARRLVRPALRATVRLGLFERLLPGVTVVARRAEDDDEGGLEQWLRATWPRLGQGPLAAGTPLHLAVLGGSAGPGGSGEGRRWVGMVWRGAEERPRVVVKVLPGPGDERADAEPEVLRELARLAPGGLAVPRLLATGQVAGRPVTVETALPGRPLLARLREVRGPDALLPALAGTVGWLSALARASARPLAGAEAEAWITAPLRSGADGVLLDAGERAALAVLGARAEDLLRSASLPAVLTHADAGPPNLLVDRAGRPVSLVDWESGGWGLPLTDVLYLLTRVAEESGQDVGSLAVATGAASRYARQARTLLEDARRRAGVDPGWLPVLAALTWLHHAANEERRRLPGAAEGVSRQRLRGHLLAVAGSAR